jgi:hypothetical protein
LLYGETKGDKKRVSDLMRIRHALTWVNGDL